MFVIRNYNRFMVGTVDSFHWEDFYIHRFSHEYDKLLRFEKYEQAETFINEHPEIENDFDAWIVDYPREGWNH